MLEVSRIKLDDSSIFLKSVLKKVYFKHFYVKLFDSCLYEKKRKKKENLCPGIPKCMYYGVVRFKSGCLVL